MTPFPFNIAAPASLLSTTLAVALPSLRAQDLRPAARYVTPLTPIGSIGEDRLRMAQLRGEAPSADWLARTPSRMTPDNGGVTLELWRLCRLSASLVPGFATLSWNSDIPFARNDAGVWAGRGITVAAAAGVRVRCGRLRAYVVPEAWHTENRAFQVLPSGGNLCPVGFLPAEFVCRSEFASPFHSTPESSADLPLRLGVQPVTALQPGQTSVTIDLGRASVGWSTESEWWGPGIRNALVMSNNAAGIPRWFVGTSRPLPTRIGQLSARLISGILTESRFFERFERNVPRPISGVVITLATAADTNLSVGVARTVYRRRTSRLVPAHALDALTYWRLRSTRDSADQLTSLFARWVFPTAGFEVYGELAKTGRYASLHQLLTAPQDGQGFTVGLQWLAHPDGRDSGWRAQLELTNLEQTRRSPVEWPATFYTSSVVPHGYTQRGRVIGAAIGPGAQSQWLALDRLSKRSTAGAFLGRIRWEQDQYATRPAGLLFYAHDVSVYGGVRGTWRGRFVDYAGELLLEKRFNYLFQHANHGFGQDPTFDVNNISLRIRVARE